MRRLSTIGAALLIAACGAEEPPVVDVQSYNIDASRITVSGASSGAMMATQMHVAHSGFVHGAALLAGGPYYCSEASLSKGLDACMKGGDLNLPALVEYARAAEAAGTIDALENLASDPVWVFRGENDVVMHSDLTRGTADFYREIAAVESVVVDDIAALHGFPTLASGVACDSFETPFINACDYDAAGEALGTLYGDLGTTRCGRRSTDRSATTRRGRCDDARECAGLCARGMRGWRGVRSARCVSWLPAVDRICRRRVRDLDRLQRVGRDE